MEKFRNQDHKEASINPSSLANHFDSPPNEEARDQNSISSSSAQTLNYHPHPHRGSENKFPRDRPEPNHNPLLLSHPPAPTSKNGSIRYRECLKNHAAAVGAHVVDGCGEFMPGGEEGTPESFKCAACECHRNFHRRVEQPIWDIGSFHLSPRNYYTNPNKNHIITNNTAARMPPVVQQPSLIQHHQSSRPGPTRPVMVAFGGSNANNDGVESTSSEDDLVFRPDGGGRMMIGLGDSLNYYHPDGEGSGKKRFRTKFTAEQKEKMAEFAEKLGWKISKQDEHELTRFCTETGVKRQVFKVWMHNSKQAMKKKNQM